MQENKADIGRCMCGRAGRRAGACCMQACARVRLASVAARAELQAPAGKHD